MKLNEVQMDLRTMQRKAKRRMNQKPEIYAKRDRSKHMHNKLSKQQTKERLEDAMLNGSEEKSKYRTEVQSEEASGTGAKSEADTQALK